MRPAGRQRRYCNENPRSGGPPKESHQGRLSWGVKPKNVPKMLDQRRTPPRKSKKNPSREMILKRTTCGFKKGGQNGWPNFLAARGEDVLSGGGAEEGTDGVFFSLAACESGGGKSRGRGTSIGGGRGRFSFCGSLNLGRQQWET